MYEWTPFEPDHAELRHQCVLREGRRQERLVAALPRADYRRFIEILEKGDASRLGVGFASAATWRGAVALGLVPKDGFLVATLPDVAEVYAAPFGRTRRRLLPVGETELKRDPTAVDVLAHDLAQLADYQHALEREGEGPPADPHFALCGHSATSPAVRLRLAAVLGPRLVDGASEPTVGFASDARLANFPVAALAGAVGAALEALRPASERLVLRHVPADLPPYRDRRPLAYAGVAAAALAAAAAAYQFRPDAQEKKAPPVEERAAAPIEETEAPAAPPPAAAPVAPAAPTVASLLEVASAGPGKVRLRWSAGAEGRALRRRRLAKDGASDGPSAVVRMLAAAAGETIDETPGAGGLYGWSVDDGKETSAYVDVKVEVELVGPGDKGGARFLLRRPWRDGSATVEVDVAPGGRLAGTDGELVFDSGLRLDAVRTRVESERAAAQVPRFRPDGRVERGADGGVATSERVVERERRVFEVDVVAPDGARRTWSRKMTDG
jgi:hypothetical protein